MTDANVAVPLLNYQTPPQHCPSNRTRTVLALCALGSNLLAQLGCLAVGVSQLGLLHRAADGMPILSSEAEANDLRYRAAHIVLLVTLLLSMIFLLMWMYRAHKNLSALTNRKLEFTPGAAVGWWFCPFLNLVRPYQVMKEIYQISREQFGRGSATIVSAWWTFWILANIVPRVATAATANTGAPRTILSFIAQTWANMVDIPLFLIAGALIMWIIYAVNDAQEKRRTSVTTDSWHLRNSVIPLPIFKRRPWRAAVQGRLRASSANVSGTVRPCDR